MPPLQCPTVQHTDYCRKFSLVMILFKPGARHVQRMSRETTPIQRLNFVPPAKVVESLEGCLLQGNICCEAMSLEPHDRELLKFISNGPHATNTHGRVNIISALQHRGANKMILGHTVSIMRCGYTGTRRKVALEPKWPQHHADSHSHYALSGNSTSTV